MTIEPALIVVASIFCSASALYTLVRLAMFKRNLSSDFDAHMFNLNSADPKINFLLPSPPLNREIHYPRFTYVLAVWLSACVKQLTTKQAFSAVSIGGEVLQALLACSAVVFLLSQYEATADISLMFALGTTVFLLFLISPMNLAWDRSTTQTYRSWTDVWLNLVYLVLLCLYAGSDASTTPNLIAAIALLLGLIVGASAAITQFCWQHLHFLMPIIWFSLAKISTTVLLFFAAGHIITSVFNYKVISFYVAHKRWYSRNWRVYPYVSNMRFLPQKNDRTGTLRLKSSSSLVVNALDNYAPFLLLLSLLPLLGEPASIVGSNEPVSDITWLLAFMIALNLFLFTITSFGVLKIFGNSDRYLYGICLPTVCLSALTITSESLLMATISTLLCLSAIQFFSKSFKVLQLPESTTYSSFGESKSSELHHFLKKVFSWSLIDAGFIDRPLTFHFVNSRECAPFSNKFAEILREDAVLLEKIHSSSLKSPPSINHLWYSTRLLETFHYMDDLCQRKSIQIQTSWPHIEKHVSPDLIITTSQMREELDRAGILKTSTFQPIFSSNGFCVQVCSNRVVDLFNRNS